MPTTSPRADRAKLPGQSVSFNLFASALVKRVCRSRFWRELTTKIVAVDFVERKDEPSLAARFNLNDCIPSIRCCRKGRREDRSVRLVKSAGRRYFDSRDPREPSQDLFAICERLRFVPLRRKLLT